MVWGDKSPLLCVFYPIKHISARSQTRKMRRNDQIYGKCQIDVAVLNFKSNTAQIFSTFARFMGKRINNARSQKQTQG